MIKWLLYGLIGSLITIARNSMFRAYTLEWAISSKIMWIGLIASVLMMYFWSVWFATAPSFFLAWFLASAVLTTLGFIATVLVFGEAISLLNIIGVLLIFVGSYLLVMKP